MLDGLKQTKPTKARKPNETQQRMWTPAEDRALLDLSYASMDLPSGRQRFKRIADGLDTRSWQMVRERLSRLEKQFERGLDAEEPTMTAEEVRAAALAEGLTLESSTSKSGFQDVTMPCAGRTGFRASVYMGAQKLHLGYFGTPEEAALHAARHRAQTDGAMHDDHWVASIFN